ncbi:serine hydrolase domain-containing protein [Virgibacillus litoralis]|uniref:CubicO group peptidase (Beta-lactamase class C family) n=1 Tax=Virgibacillus litoralis TaxID=578221 RepID=A0ABS4HAY7_9BACI|nr:serine hydrolase domain-containing protein [Virgibacillus litoralis]MBP1948033.1 CubicO group peptidase (beta-lactamase class C family) [Virgibacillus litoralis]
MRRKLSYITLSVIVSTSFLATTGLPASADKAPNPTIEKKDKKNVQEKAHPKFGWGIPGPTSPILHPGSVKGAGMVAEPLNEIESVMESMISDNVMPGAVTFVARRGHIVQHEAYGDAAIYQDDSGNQLEDPVAMSKDTIFDVASLSKIFTTIAAMKLHEQGQFNLDDPVADYIPEFAQNGKENVTIRQLMTHTSGFKPWVPLYTIGENKQDRLQYVFEYPLDNEPGSTYTYSDLNMITLAVIVERISGKGLDQFVKENITEPLNMTDTMYNPPEELKDQIAATEYQPWTDRGLVWGEVHDENAWSLGGVAGHAGVFSTANDLAKLGHMMINDGRYGSKQILQPETVELLVENQIPQFPGDEHGLGFELAQGWYMDALSESSTIGHTGYTGTSFVVNQNNDTIAILLTNRVHPTRETVSTNPARRQFARQVADAIPVTTPGSNDTWFSGYGDNTNQTLTAEVDVENDTSLSFDTWYRIEHGYDFGVVEVSDDGQSWTSTGESFTGSSINWQSQEVKIPAGTKYIRFNYQTDTYTNGRGWYISNLELSNGHSVDFTSQDWVKRDY